MDDNDLTRIKDLIKKGSCINENEEEELQCLLDETKRSDRNQQEVIIKKLNEKNNGLFPSTFLHFILQYRHCDVKYLIKFGADPRTKLDNGETPLHIAVFRNLGEEIIKALIQTKHVYGACTEQDTGCQCGHEALKIANKMDELPKDMAVKRGITWKILLTEEVLYDLRMGENVFSIHKLLEEKELVDFTDEFPSQATDIIIGKVRENGQPPINDEEDIRNRCFLLILMFPLLSKQVMEGAMKWSQDNYANSYAAFTLSVLLDIKGRSEKEDFLSWQSMEENLKDSNEILKEMHGKFEQDRKILGYLITQTARSGLHEQRNNLLVRYHKIYNKDNEPGARIDWSGLMLAMDKKWVHDREFQPISHANFVDLSRNLLTSCPQVYKEKEGFQWIKYLTDLRLDDNCISTVCKEIFAMEGLHVLSLRGNKIKKLDSNIKFSKSLKTLDLKRNLLSSLPSSLKDSSICHLNIAENNFEIVPDHVCMMKFLKNLDISGNKGIFELPLLFGKLPISTIIDFSNMEQLCYDNEVKKDSATLINHMKSKLYKQGVNRTINVIFVGGKEHGKTKLLDAIFGNARNLITTHVEIYEPYKFTSFGRKYELRPIEFPAEIGTNQCFLTTNSLYLLVWDVNKNENDLYKCGLYWLSCLQTFAKNSKVLFIGTKVDKIEKSNNARENTEKNVNAVFQKLLNKFAEVRDLNIHRKVEWLNDRENNRDVKKLRNVIKNVAFSVHERRVIDRKVLGGNFPWFYFKLINIIKREREKKEPFILRDDLFEELRNSINENCGIFANEASKDISDEYLHQALEFLKSIGHCLHFKEAKKNDDQDLVFIDFEWFQRKIDQLQRNDLNKDQFSRTEIENMVKFNVIPFLKSFNIAFRIAEDKYQMMNPLAFNENIKESKFFTGLTEEEKMCRIYVFHNGIIPCDFWVKLLSRVLDQFEDLVLKSDMSKYEMYLKCRKCPRQQFHKPRYWKKGLVYEDSNANEDQRLFFSLLQFDDAESMKNVQWLKDLTAKKDKFYKVPVFKIEVMCKEDKIRMNVFSKLISHVNWVLKESFPYLQLDIEHPDLQVIEYAPCYLCRKYRRHCHLFSQKDCFDHLEMNEFKSSPCECSHRHRVELTRLFPEFVCEDCPDLRLAPCHHLTDVSDNLGKGAGGIVKSGKLHPHYICDARECREPHETPSMDVAIKYQKDPKWSLNKAKDFLHFRQECILLLDAADHPNIVTVYGVHLNLEFPSNEVKKEDNPMPMEYDTRVAILLEYVEEGSLSMKIRSLKENKGIFERILLYRICFQLADGLAYIHYLNMCHRDIKSDNVLFMSDDIFKDTNVKITDFGTTTVALTNMYENDGTTHYMAPELFSKRSYTSAIDIWSFGCVIFELLTLETPYSKIDPRIIPDHLNNERTPDMIHNDFREDGHCLRKLMKSKCWYLDENAHSFDDRHRPTSCHLKYLLQVDCFQSFLYAHSVFIDDKPEETFNRLMLLSKCDGDNILVVLSSWVLPARPENTFRLSTINVTCAKKDWLYNSTQTAINFESFLDLYTENDKEIVLLGKNGNSIVANKVSFQEFELEMFNDVNERDELLESTLPTINTVADIKIDGLKDVIKCRFFKSYKAFILYYKDDKNKLQIKCCQLDQDQLDGGYWSDTTDINNRRPTDILLMKEPRNLLVMSCRDKNHQVNKLAVFQIINKGIHYELEINLRNAFKDNNSDIESLYAYGKYIVVTYESRFVLAPILFENNVSHGDLVEEQLHSILGRNVQVTSFCSIYDTLWFGWKNGCILVYKISEHQKQTSLTLLRYMKPYTVPVEALVPIKRNTGQIGRPSFIASYGKQLNKDALYKISREEMDWPEDVTKERKRLLFDRSFFDLVGDSKGPQDSHDLLLFWYAVEGDKMERLFMTSAERKVWKGEKPAETTERNANLQQLNNHKECCKKKH